MNETHLRKAGRGQANGFVHRVARDAYTERRDDASRRNDRAVAGAAADINYQPGVFVCQLQAGAESGRQSFIDQIDPAGAHFMSSFAD